MKGWLYAGALMCAQLATAAPPVLSGLFQVGRAGVVEFRIQGKQTVGLWKLDQACTSNPESEVVKGVIEGGVFIGDINVCQEGKGCSPTRTVPFVAIGSANNTVTAFVKLDAACTSKALENGRLVIRPADLAIKEKIQGAVSASAIAKGDDPEKLAQEVAALMTEQKFEQAAARLKRLVVIEPKAFVFRRDLGAVLLETGDIAGAREALERARELGAPNRIQEGELAMNLALAYSRDRNGADTETVIREVSKAEELMGVQKVYDVFLDDERLRQLLPKRFEALRAKAQKKGSR
jgi:hypothetical protein